MSSVQSSLSSLAAASVPVKANGKTTTTTDQSAIIAALMAKVAELEAKQASNKRELSYKVSVKGALSVYGLNARFPITLYKEQWERLLAKSDEIKAILANPANKFAVK